MNSFKKLLIGFLSIIVFVGFGVGVVGLNSTYAASTTTYNIEQIMTEYLIGTSVIFSNENKDDTTIFPQTIDVNGKSATVSVITFPNGVSYSVNESVILNQLGKYKIIYKDNQNNCYVDSFIVKNTLANVTSNGYLQTLIELPSVEAEYLQSALIAISNEEVDGKTVFPQTVITGDKTLEFVSYTMPGGDTFSEKEFALDRKGKYLLTYKDDSENEYCVSFNSVEKLKGTAKNSSGVRAVLTSGSTATFNKVIDLTKSEDDGFVNLYSHNFTATNTFEGDKFADCINITITDVNNPEIFIKVVYQLDIGIGFYLRAMTKDLPEVGLLPREKGGEIATGSNRVLITYIDGERYGAYYGWAGRYGSGDYADHTIRYNPSTQEMTCNGQLFIDLDDINSYPAGSKLFEGFPSDNVYLTVSAINQTKTVSVEFSQIGDSIGEDLASFYSNGIGDVDAPFLTVDCETDEVGNLYAKYGGRLELPKATAVDANVVSEVFVDVYKNYTTSQKQYVPKNTDGSLTLAEKTVYTLEYYCFDAYGNRATKLIKVVPVEREDLTVGDVKVDGNIRLAFNKISLETGVLQNAKIFEVFETLNDANKLQLTVTIRHAGQVSFEKTLNGDDLEGENYFDFIPYSSGDYVVCYEYFDGITSGSETYTVTCNSNGAVNFLENPLPYRCYVYGMEYDLSAYTAYKFSQEVTTQETNVFVSYDNGETWKPASKSFVVGANEQGVVPVEQTVSQIKFKYVSGSVVQETDSVPIIDVRKDKSRSLELVAPNGNLDYSKYFIADAFEVTANARREYVFEANQNSGSAKISVISPLTFDKNGEFYLSFKTFYELKDFTKVSVILTDAYDPSNSLKFNYELVKDDTMLSLENGRKFISSDIPLFKNDGVNTQNELDFTYSFYDKSITTCNMGFNAEFKPSNNIFYVDVELSGITGQNAGIAITTVANQSISSSVAVDNKAPICFFNSTGGNRAIGSKVVIYPPLVMDFVSPYNPKNTKIKVTVNKNPIMSEEGVLLNGIDNDPTKNYTVVVSDYVVYKVEYIVTDSSGKTDSPNFFFRGVDAVAPQITLGFGFTEDTIHNVTLGKPFSIDFTVTDDISSNENIYTRVMIINDLTGRITYSEKPMEYAETESDYKLITDTCTLTEKGMYTVYVFASDEADNTSFAKYKLSVK